MTAFRPFDQPIVDSSAFTYPKGYQLSGHGRCRSCGASIAWMVNIRTGTTQPFEANGESHFAHCPHAQEWREGKLGRKKAVR